MEDFAEEEEADIWPFVVFVDDAGVFVPLDWVPFLRAGTGLRLKVGAVRDREVVGKATGWIPFEPGVPRGVTSPAVLSRKKNMCL